MSTFPIQPTCMKELNSLINSHSLLFSPSSFKDLSLPPGRTMSHCSLLSFIFLSLFFCSALAAKECGICWEEFTCSSPPIKCPQPKCDKSFHAHCTFIYLREQRDKPCPCCRRPFYPESRIFSGPFTVFPLTFRKKEAIFLTLNPADYTQVFNLQAELPSLQKGIVVHQICLLITLLLAVALGALGVDIGTLIVGSGAIYVGIRLFYYFGRLFVVERALRRFIV